MSPHEAEPLPTLYSDTLADDEPTAVYPPSFHAVVAALRGHGPDSWPALASVQTDLDAPRS